MEVIKYLMRRSWVLPAGVPSNRKRFLAQNEYSRLKWVFKFFKRRLLCFILIEHFGLTRECSRIDPKHKRILWINWAAPSLGDSLMDLSGRVLLEGRDLILLTHPKNASLYARDPVFSSVFSDSRALLVALGNIQFDLVICDSYSPRALIQKLKISPFTPFVGLYGFVNGFEVHRTLFAFARMRELLDDQVVIKCPKRPTVWHEKRLKASDGCDVCIAVGGEWEFRTYGHWVPIARWLVARGLSVLLVGSCNGTRMATEICVKVPSVKSKVGESSLPGVVADIAKSRVFIGSDGGLWHIACGIPIPSVVLFADCQIFDENGKRVTRETQDIICEVLYDDVNVSNIAVSAVISAFERLAERIDLHATPFYSEAPAR